MEMIENDIYSSAQITTAPQTQRDYRPRQNDSLWSPLFRLVVIPLWLLAAVLLSLLIYKWSLCIGSSCASCPSCPDFWMKHGNNCYYFSLEKKTWNSSLEFCLANDSNLFMLTDSKEKQLLKNILNFNFYWIGLRKNLNWRWLDGSAIDSSRIFTNSLVQNCGAINQDGIHASSCEFPLQWICKKSRL
ncbi:killer cell lectin-like receptor subfamily G member 1 [Erinaceus europaeus]|uniref:Killer cell lectin-like receptor subfamily G member 1 n=1 Tax=Erinaceus europaeus TaxID=9365 RepID=A0ABM3XBA2_ERIEU|nr:killer cell lectin-like receptor subfamily G member 1 [Erinaceus europaeus]